MLLLGDILGGLVAKANNISAVSPVPLRRQLPCDLHRFLALPLPKDCSSKQPRIPAASVSQTHLLLQVTQSFSKPSPYRKYPVYPWPPSSIVCNNTFALLFILFPGCSVLSLRITKRPRLWGQPRHREIECCKAGEQSWSFPKGKKKRGDVSLT